MNRRDVLKIGMGSVAALISNAVVVKNVQQRDVLVILVDATVNQRQAARMYDALKRAGIEAVVINRAVGEAAVVGKDRTFFSADPPLRDYGIMKVCGNLVDRGRWCETSLGLVCEWDENYRELKVNCYGPGAVTFEPLPLR